MTLTTLTISVAHCCLTVTESKVGEVEARLSGVAAALYTTHVFGRHRLDGSKMNKHATSHTPNLHPHHEHQENPHVRSDHRASSVLLQVVFSSWRLPGTVSNDGSHSKEENRLGSSDDNTRRARKPPCSLLIFDISQRAWQVVCQGRVHHSTSGQAMWRDRSSHRLELPKRCAEWTLRHLTAILYLDVSLERAYTMQTPAREKDTIERTTIEIPVIPLHESVSCR